MSVRRAEKSFSAPQTVEQVSMIHEFLNSNEAIYATIKSKGGKPTTQHATVLSFPKLRGRGVPLPLPPKVRRLAA